MWYCTSLPFLDEKCGTVPYTRGGHTLCSFASVTRDTQNFEDVLLNYCANDGLLTMLILWGVAMQINDSIKKIQKNRYWRQNDFVMTAMEQMREYLQHPSLLAKKLVADPEIPNH